MLFLQAFRDYLCDQGRGALTVSGYAQDLALFARWFEHTNGEPLTPAALTLTDAREYRQHLLRHKAKPATINRHLAALKAYAVWAAETGQVDGNPISIVRGVSEQKHAPRWLDRKAQARLRRELVGWKLNFATNYLLSFPNNDNVTHLLNTNQEMGYAWSKTKQV